MHCQHCLEEEKRRLPGIVRIGGLNSMNENRPDFTNPLPQKVEYNIEEHLIYGKQKNWKKVIEWIITIFAWVVLATYIVYLIYGGLSIHNGWYLPEFLFFSKEMVLTIGHYFYILGIACLIFILLLIFWKNYNKRRFGKLHRRRFRPPVTNDEIEETFHIDANMVHAMQERRMIVLEHNIIPEDMGMGREKKNKKT